MVGANISKSGILFIIQKQIKNKMNIQINTDNNISGNERLETYVQSTITKELSRFNDDITRIEVHLSDENGSKEGEKDKRCMIEARLKNIQPIAVTSQENTIEKAVSDALNKIKASIDTIIGRSKNH